MPQLVFRASSVHGCVHECLCMHLRLTRSPLAGSAIPRMPSAFSAPAMSPEQFTIFTAVTGCMNAFATDIITEICLSQQCHSLGHRPSCALAVSYPWIDTHTTGPHGCSAAQNTWKQCKTIGLLHGTQEAVSCIVNRKPPRLHLGAFTTRILYTVSLYMSDRIERYLATSLTP